MSFTIKTSKQGATSDTFSINNIFFKFSHGGDNYKHCQLYKREKYIATILNKYDWFPTLLFTYNDKDLLIYEYCGVSLNRDNCPNDAIDQINNILLDLEKENIQHNDIKLDELLVNENGKIFLCDFGWGSINNNMNCGIDLWDCPNTEKPGGWYNDKTVIERLKIAKIIKQAK